MTTELATKESTDIERPVVYALDLDEDLLSHLADPESWLVLQAEGLDPQLIEDDFVRDVYDWQLQHQRKHHRPATASVLADTFDLDLVEPLTAAGDLLDRLRERYANNKQRDKLRQVVKLQHEDPLQVSAAMIQAGRELAQLLQPKGEMFGTGDFLRAKHRYDIKAMQGPGASFGHPLIDEYFYGMRGLTFWIAPPKRYKSWMMIKAVIENVRQGKAAWLYSLELPAEETDMRLRCLLADIPWYRYTKNMLSEAEWKLIEHASETIDGMGMYKIVKPPDGERDMDSMVFKARDAGADVIFFDQLQYIETDGQNLGAWNETGKYWKVLNRARDLSDEGPLGIAHQFNREARWADSMPPIENAKGSSSIEETATVALGMFANKDMMRSGTVEVGTLISRNSGLASWEMDVDLSRGCSFEIERRLEDE